jgi:hypothetical protein
MAVPAFGVRRSDRVGVAVGLMDWIGTDPPNAAKIAGHGVLEQ